MRMEFPVIRKDHRGILILRACVSKIWSLRDCFVGYLLDSIGYKKQKEKCDH